MPTARLDPPEPPRDGPAPGSWPSARALAWCADPPRWALMAAWMLILLALVSVRLHLMQALPVYLWSKDAPSYAASAWRWLDTGAWQTDPFRGATYSLLIAGCLAAWGNFTALMAVQHVIGGLCVLAAIIVLWRLHGPRAWLPATACGLAYALYAGPIAAEHLVRNEALIFLFASGALISWFVALRQDSQLWLVLCGLNVALLILTKNVFAPLPAVIIAALLWLHPRKVRGAAWRVALFATACGLPLAADRLLAQSTAGVLPPKPQSGLLLYARVAQFTRLDGGIEPELKAKIRDDILAYRARPKLDNNVILHRTVIPRLRAELEAQDRTPTDVHRLCRSLAFEAIRAHPREYFAQILADLRRLHREYGEDLRKPDADELATAASNLMRSDASHPSLQREETLAKLEALRRPETFQTYRRFVAGAWLFNLRPVLLTSLLLPLLTVCAAGRMRWWWLALCVVWFFNVILLCTVGKPMERYLIPVTPVMFWTLASAVCGLWLKLLDAASWLLHRRALASSIPQPAPTLSHFTS